ncbi:2-hydroxychromene-2-carboxylate isomerase [Methylocapsa sp. S129]|uniref:2-hydroxychromene-2-carboxylate isomerase n=1 Tax=Methylocapsa sp. S129 TaxID=1641869 RepID=UPI00131D3B75|nr:2-hydroxychromene-2-carboxylate isomerase [Methylocapsa sp. S129]
MSKQQPTVEHHFDFGSPNCYFAHRVIGAIEQRTGATFTYVPILLGGVFKATNNQAPLIAFKDIANKLAYDRLEIRRFIARHRLDRFRMNPHFPVNTLQIMRGVTALQDDPSFMATVEALFCLMWEDGKKMDDAEIIVQSLNERGLDGKAFLARASEPDVKAKLMANTERSVARGAFGAPTFFVGDEIYFGKDRLRDVEEAIVAATG